MIIDGKKIAEEILGELKGSYKLGVIMNLSSPASDSFVKMKERAAVRAGMQIVRYGPEDIDKALLCDGVLVQLPIANAEELIAAIPPQKDVDALGPHALVQSPIAEAISEIFIRAGVAAKGKKAVVVGKGRLVGAPAAELLRSLGAQVVVITKPEGSLEELQDADIVVLGAGKPGIIGPDMVKEGVVLIDAGTSEAGGKLMGDAEPGLRHVASVFTPVPGGVGPIAVAMIFKNLAVLAKRK